MACQKVLTPESTADRAGSVALVAATIADIPRLAELDRRCFGARCWSPAAWNAAVRDPACDTVIAREGDRMIGAMVLLPGRPEASLASIAVDAPHRGRGIGTRLLDEAVRRARVGRARWLTLEVDAGAAAVRFYRREGFAVTGRFREDGRERLAMARRLGGHDDR